MKCKKTYYVAKLISYKETAWYVVENDIDRNIQSTIGVACETKKQAEEILKNFLED